MTEVLNHAHKAILSSPKSMLKAVGGTFRITFKGRRRRSQVAGGQRAATGAYK